MIPRAHVTAWRASAPWPTDAQIEQDLVLSRALVEMLNRPAVAQALAYTTGSLPRVPRNPGASATFMLETSLEKAAISTCSARYFGTRQKEADVRPWHLPVNFQKGRISSGYLKQHWAHSHPHRGPAG